MKTIEEVLGDGPEKFIETYGLEEFKKTQDDPEYLIKNYLADEGDDVKREVIPGNNGYSQIHIIVTEPNGHWLKFKFLKRDEVNVPDNFLDNLHTL